MWPEVKLVLDGNKRELCLSGDEIATRIEQEGLDPNIFKLANLNLLRINDARVKNLPQDISFLVNLQSLVLYANEIENLPESIDQLQKLKLLDLSRNKLKEFARCICSLANIETINLSSNALSIVPSNLAFKKLTVLDLSYNQLGDFSEICTDSMTSLTNLLLKSNEIIKVPPEIVKLINLKVLDLSANKITAIPKVLSTMPKLKQFELSDNDLADKRLLKLVKQCRSKQILDYVKINGTDESIKVEVTESAAKQRPEGDKNEKLIYVKRHANSDLVVIYDDIVKTVRPHILCCMIRNLNFTSELLRKFLQIQSKIHDTVCAKREKSVLATHDLALLKTRTLNYTAKSPNEIFIQPLGQSSKISAATMYRNLKAEAETLRKEKKRNVFSGIHKFLYLLGDKDVFSCLEDLDGNVISLHPLTNSDISKISTATTDIFIEVSSSTDMNSCRTAMEMLITEMYNLMINSRQNKLIVQQVKITDKDGNLKNIYPSKIDLQLAKPFTVEVEKV